MRKISWTLQSGSEHFPLLPFPHTPPHREHLGFQSHTILPPPLLLIPPLTSNTPLPQHTAPSPPIPYIPLPPSQRRCHDLSANYMRSHALSVQYSKHVGVWFDIALKLQPIRVNTRPKIRKTHQRIRSQSGYCKTRNPPVRLSGGLRHLLENSRGNTLQSLE
jgi:hypothetical protein